MLCMIAADSASHKRLPPGVAGNSLLTTLLTSLNQSGIIRRQTPVAVHLAETVAILPPYAPYE